MENMGTIKPATHESNARRDPGSNGLIERGDTTNALNAKRPFQSIFSDFNGLLKDLDAQFS